MTVSSSANTSAKLKTPRRTLNRLAIMVLALSLGGLAQSAFRQDGLWDGLILYLLAVILFVRTISATERRTQQLIPPYRGLFASLGVYEGSMRWVGAWIIIGAVLVSFISYRLFDDEDLLLQAWQFYAGSLILLLIGTLLLTRKKQIVSSQEQPKPWLVFGFPISPYTAILGLILLLAVLLRVWQFGSLPFGVWYDEAEAGLQARRWLEEIKYKPAFYDPINVSGQFLFLYSRALSLISDTVYGLRTVSVLFGVGGVLLAYLFGRTIRGPVFGLIMAFIMAVMRWDINFSRIAMTGIDAPFFELLTLYFLARLFRWGSVRDAIFSGIALGLGLSFYTGFRLFVLALGLFFLLALLIWPHWWKMIRNLPWAGKQGVRILLLAGALWITIMPVSQYASRNPESFSNRLQVTSIFNRREDPDLGRALLSNLGKHLAMFNIKGDRNGRHNLPAEPILDPVTGTLLILGLGLVLKNVTGRGIKPDHLFFLLLLPASLVGGVFTLDFEAPQSLRSIAALPAVAYLSALTIIVIVKEALRVTQPLPVKWLLWPATVAGAILLTLNAHTYFVRQANDFAVWNAFSTPETLAGQRMAELGPDYDFILSPFLTNHPTIRFISPNTPRHLTLPLPDALPVRTNGNRPVAMFIHPDDDWILDEAMTLYQSATFESLSNEPENPAAVHMAIFSPADLAAVQGLSLRYWAGPEKTEDQPPTGAIRTDTVDVDWTTTMPLQPPFVAEWQGVLYVNHYGRYQLRLEAPEEAVLEIDGVELLRGQGEQQIVWDLAEGNHLFRLEAKSGDGVVRLHWQPPGAPEALIPAPVFYHDPVSYNGLLGRYYFNPDWNGTPALMRIDPFLDTYFHLTPMARPYSVEWTGMLEVPVTGIYGIGLRSVGSSQLSIDGTMVVEADMPDQYIENSVSLQAGLHPISILFQDTLPRSRIHFWWRPPGEIEPQPVPKTNLWPPLGSAWNPETETVSANTSFEVSPVELSYLTTLSEGLLQPRDVTVGPEGDVYVVDTGTRGVHVFSDDMLVDTWTESVDGVFEEPLALVTDSTGDIWVLDSTRQWIYSFGENGEPLGKIGGPEAFFYHPRGLTVFGQPDRGDTLVVADTGSGLLRLFSTEGTPLGTVGFFGEAPGQFSEPVDAIRDEFGAYYVTEGANINRWQRVDPFSKPLSDWPLDAQPAFDGSHMAWGPDGSIFMTNSGKGVIRRYSPDGSLLTEWQTIGDVTFVQPVGIYVDTAQNRLYVTDLGSSAVHIFNIEVVTLAP